MTSYELWLFLHISAAMVWIGGATVAQVFGVLAQRSGDPAQSAVFGRSMGFIGPKIFMPASIAVLVTGVLLTEDGNWEWSESFIWLGIVLWAAVSLVAFAFLTRAMGRVGARMAAEGPSPELGAEVRKLVLLARVLILVLFVIVFVMIVKPGT
ncbi:MAG TPA: DUF2269 family protein [Gaiellaceae bacterium]|nr:DUF2269 family protein [Gaiellaceae bacterium]